MNTAASTNQTRPATAGSVENFVTGIDPNGQEQLTLDGFPAVVTSASIAFTDPSGNTVGPFAATITNAGMSIHYVWPIPNTPGLWERYWAFVFDTLSVPQVSLPLSFKVISNPFV
jgi:hypothetical protein